MNRYAINLCKAQSQHQNYLSFWASISAEAVSGRLDLARSGRKEIERQRQEDVLLKILPCLKDGLSMQNSPEMIIACFTFAIILARKSQLGDKVLDGLMDAVSSALTSQTMDAGIICLSLLAQQKSDQSLKKRVRTRLESADATELRLQRLKPHYHIEPLVLALIQSALSDKRAKSRLGSLNFVERLLFADTVAPTRITATIILLLKSLGSGDGGLASALTEDNVASSLIKRVKDSDLFSAPFAVALRESGFSMSSIANGSPSTIDKAEIPLAGCNDMDVDSEARHDAEHALSRVLEEVSPHVADEQSFLSSSSSTLFNTLVKAFVLASQKSGGIALFLDLPLWRISMDMNITLFASFFLRVVCGPYSPHLRHAALTRIHTWLLKLSNVDTQAILPYVLPQLADPAQEIRSAAAEVLLAQDQATSSAITGGEAAKILNLHEPLGAQKNDQSPTILSSKDLSKIIQRAIVPVLEECVLDRAQISRAIQKALKTSSKNQHTRETEPSLELKKYLRRGYFQLILQTLTKTPLLSVKLGLLNLLANIDKVGGIRKRDELLPLLTHWASLSTEEIKRIAVSEGLDTGEMSSAMCGTITSAETDALETLLDLTFSAESARSDFLPAVTQRVRDIWQQMEVAQQTAASDRLLSSIFNNQAKNVDQSRIGRQLLQSLDLPTEVLVHLVNGLTISMDLAMKPSSNTKRRRINGNQSLTIENNLSDATITDLRKLTFTLELVDDLYPERRPELLSGLFHVLVNLHQFKSQDQSDLSYLLSLTLGALLSIVRAAGSDVSRIDLSAVRLDVVIDCMSATNNSQVQNNALLLITGLASLDPQLVLDSVMPVFTFMGERSLSKGDEYSNYAVDQTMDKILPALVKSLRNRDQDPRSQISHLISTFTAAYEHIPVKRRLPLFKRLVLHLGEEALLWEVVSSLSQRYAGDAKINAFIVSLTNTVNLNVQLKSCSRLLQHIQETMDNQLAPQPTTDGFEDASDVNASATISSSLVSLGEMLTKSNVGSRIARLDVTSENAMAELIPLWKGLLDRMISLVQASEAGDVGSTPVKNLLPGLLGLLPMIRFMDIAESFMQEEQQTVGRTILRLVESRLSSQHAQDAALQTRAISFLQPLFRVLGTTQDELSKHAAIACIDRICELYGRKDVRAVVQAAHVLVGDDCLGSSDTRVNTLALLSLSSFIQLVKEAIIPVIPHMMPKLFCLLQKSLEEGSEAPQLHNAVFILLSELLVQAPFIVSNDYLDQILMLSAEAKGAALGVESDDIRSQSLHLVGKNLDLVRVVGSLYRTWSTAVENDVSAVQQALSLLTESVKASSKAVVAKYSNELWALLLEVFDLRRIQLTERTEDSYTDSDVSEIENTVNTIAIEVIYRLNDTTFRPLFLRLNDWASECGDLTSDSETMQAQKLRQTTVFSFHTHFFTTLRWVVTLYASNIVEPALAVLNKISKSAAETSSISKPTQSSLAPSTMDKDTLLLYSRTLAALQSSLRYDHNGHFSSPTIFHPLAKSLVAQIHLASTPSFSATISTPIISTIKALAGAVIDTPDHLKTLNSHICALRRSTSAAVRLASIDLQLALAGADDPNPEEAEARVEDEEEDNNAAGIAEEWCGTVLSVGEGIVYVNEMQDDDDDAVRSRVRELVGRVREVVGDEGIFE
jgi:U3 small nucleolar RNA-associated protein 10